MTFARDFHSFLLVFGKGLQQKITRMDGSNARLKPFKLLELTGHIRKNERVVNNSF